MMVLFSWNKIFVPYMERYKMIQDINKRMWSMKNLKKPL